MFFIPLFRRLAFILVFLQHLRLKLGETIFLTRYVTQVLTLPSLTSCSQSEASVKC